MLLYESNDDDGTSIDRLRTRLPLLDERSKQRETRKVLKYFKHGRSPEIRLTAADLLIDYRSAIPRAYSKTFRRIERMRSSALSQKISGLRSSDPAVVGYSIALLAKVSPKPIGAVDALVRCAGSADSFIRRGALDALKEGTPSNHLRRVMSKLVPFLQDPDDQVRSAVARILRQAPMNHPLGRKVVPGALKSGHVEVRQFAAIALARSEDLASKCLDAILAACGDSDGIVRSAAASALRKIVPRVKVPANRLLSLLESNDPTVRAEAAAAIHSVEPHYRGAQAERIVRLANVPEFHRKASELSKGVMSGGKTELSRTVKGVLKLLRTYIELPTRRYLDDLVHVYGPEASRDLVLAFAIVVKARDKTTESEIIAQASDPQVFVAEAFADALADRDQRVRDLALHMLANPALQEMRSSLTLARLLESKDSSVRISAANLLEWAKPISRDEYPYLEKAAKDKHPEVRRAVFRRLVAFADIQPKALRIVTKAIKDPDARVRHAALFSLHQAHSNLPGALKSLVEATRDPESSIAAFAADALGQLASHLEQIPNSVIKSLNSALARSEPVAATAASALSLFGASAKETIPTLCKLVVSKKIVAGRAAAQTLGSLSRPSERDLGCLRKGLRHPWPGVQLNAARALAGVGECQDEVILTLDPLLKNKSLEVRLDAVEIRFEINEDLRPVFSILKEGLESSEERLRHLAVHILMRSKSKSEALPLLIKALDDHSTHVADSIIMALIECGPKASAAVPKLVEIVKRNAFGCTHWAAKALGSIGVATPEVVEALEHLQDYGEGHVRGVAAEALGRLGVGSKKSLDTLLKQLKKYDYGERYSAAEALGKLGKLAEPAVPALIESMRTGNRAAPLALAEINLNLDEVVPALLEAMKHEDEYVRIPAAEALGMIGKGRVGVLDGLASAVSDSSGHVRENAAKSLIALEANPTEYLPTIVKALSAKSTDLRYQATDMLAELGERAAGALTELRQALLDSDSNVRKCSARAVACIGERADAAVPELIELLNDTDMKVREWAAYALGKIGTGSAKALSQLIARLVDKSAGVRAQAVFALGRLGIEAKEAEPALIKMLQDPDEKVRQASVRALGRLGTSEEKAILALMDSMKDMRGSVREAAVDALAELGPASARATQAIIRALKDEYEEVRRSAAVALAKIDAEPKVAVPALAKALEDETIRWNATYALSHFGAKAAAAVPALINVLGDQTEQIRINAVMALGTIGPAASSAVPHLIRTLNGTKQVKSATVDTLGAIGPKAKKALPALRKVLKDKEMAKKASLAIKTIQGKDVSSV